MSIHHELDCVGCVTTGWRNITVRFDGDPTSERDIVAGAAVRTIEHELARMQAAEQVACVVQLDWATWTFMPGRHEPAELIQVVHRVLSRHDPGWWLIQADD
jgi:hypothetical protein